MDIESLRNILKSISSEILITILVPGFFLSSLFIKFFSNNIMKINILSMNYFEIMLFFVISLVFGWTSHYIALELYSFLIGKNGLNRVKKKGTYPQNMRVYRNFFANISLTLPLFLGFIFNCWVAIISFVVYFIISIRIYIQCEDAKKEEE